MVCESKIRIFALLRLSFTAHSIYYNLDRLDMIRGSGKYTEYPVSLVFWSEIFLCKIGAHLIPTSHPCNLHPKSFETSDGYVKHYVYVPFYSYGPGSLGY